MSEAVLEGAISVVRLSTRDPAFEHCRVIRRSVFVQEQRVDLALEFDGLDDEADHFLAWRADPGSGRVAVGTARLRPLASSSSLAPAENKRAKAERVAVSSEHRSGGIGRRLMEALESHARALGTDELLLHAQVAVIPFYEKLGYEAIGPVFEEAGIEHREMTKRLIPG